MSKRSTVATIILLGLSFSTFCFAETIVFKWGTKVKAKIIEKTDDYIKIKRNGTEFLYRLEDIESIDGKKVDITNTGRKETLVVAEGKTGVQIFKQLSPAVVYLHAGDSQGSGFVIDKKGIIVTNWHVVGSSDQITVTLKNGKAYPCASVINYDILKDICILKIDVPGELTFIPLGEYDRIDIGEKVYVIGNPLGLKYSISDGIISQKEEDVLYVKLLQFTCPISSGSSGSPLLNTKGEAIGIVKGSLFPMDSEVIVQNLNFAISSEEVKVLLKEDKHLSLSNFAEMTKGYSIIQQGNSLIADGNYKKGYQLYKSVFQKNYARTGIDGKDCLYLFFEMLKLSGSVVGQWGSLYWRQWESVGKAELERRQSGLEKIPDEEWEKLEAYKREMLNWADENIASIEALGGLRKVFEKITSEKLIPVKLYDGFKEFLCLGYYNVAEAATLVPHGREHFYYYFRKVKEAFPESETARLLTESEANAPKFWDK